MTLPTKGDEQAVEAALVQGDLSKLTSAQRVVYYNKVCQSVGLNPYTKPFEYITLNGKLTLYALRGAADQLRKLNGVSLEVVSQEEQDGIFTVHVRARDRDGRVDEDLGTAVVGTLRGEARGNAVLKAVTKAKRRATLSICGLGWLDETEVETIPGAKIGPDVIKQLPVDKPAASTPAESATPAATDKAPEEAPLPPPPGGTSFDAETGEVFESTGAVGSVENLHFMARKAADQGSDFFWTKFYAFRTDAEKTDIKKIGAELRAMMDKADKEAEEKLT